MARFSKKLIVLNIFGGLFYVFCLLQWLWASLPYLPQLISLAAKLQPVVDQPHVAVHATSSQPPSVAVVLFASIVVVAILAATAYVLFRLPIAIGKTGERLTKSASNYLVPAISHHAKLTPKKRRALTTQVIVGMKLGLCILPVIVVALSFAVTFSISYGATMLVAAFLALISLALFGTQAVSAKVLHVPLKDSW